MNRKNAILTMEQTDVRWSGEFSDVVRFVALVDAVYATLFSGRDLSSSIRTFSPTASSARSR